MGRKRTGTVITERNAAGELILVPFSTLPDGSRRRLTACPVGTPMPEARRIAAHWTKRFAEEDVTRPTTQAEIRDREEECRATVAWWTAFFAERQARGDSDWKGDRGRFEKHVRPVVDKPMASVTRDDSEQLGDALDVKIRNGTLAWKTAWNVWSVWTTACAAASASKARELRVRDDNPCLGVAASRPPRAEEQGVGVAGRDGAAARLRAGSDRLATHLRARHLPVPARRGARGARLGRHRPRARDREQPSGAHTGPARDEGHEERGKAPLRHRARSEPALLPLLRDMHTESGGKGRLVKMGDRKHWAATLRAHLAIAGVDREDLYTDDATRKHLTFHDLKATAGTRMAMRGDNPIAIMRRLPTAT